MRSEESSPRIFLKIRAGRLRERGGYTSNCEEEEEDDDEEEEEEEEEEDGREICESLVTSAAIDSEDEELGYLNRAVGGAPSLYLK